MPAAGRAVISYTVGKGHPELERAIDGAVSDLIRAFSWEGFIVESSVFPLACF